MRSALSRRTRSSRVWTACAAVFFACTFALTSVAQDQGDVHKNMGPGLRELVQRHRDMKKRHGGNMHPLGLGTHRNLATGDFDVEDPATTNLVVDDQGRVLVEIYLNGSQTLADAETSITNLGGNVTGENPYYRAGVIDAYVPLDTADDIAGLGAVSSMQLSFKPATNVGAVTSQGAAVLHADTVNAGGITGAGITVGVMSDSFNTSTATTIHAANDVATGDLPNDPVGPGLKFLLDSPNGTDEGRGMAQIVHDLAPDAHMCFATANGGQATFASNIRTLRTNGNCLADVIVDDVFYFAEPFFSDGQIAQAVDDVVTSTILGGKRVSYFSSAGNQQRMGYSAAINMIPNATARALPGQNVNLATIPATIDTTGGFQNFGTAASPQVGQVITLNASPNTIILQWDDPFDKLPAPGVTTDLDFLFFFNGNFLFASTANNFTTNEPFEGISINGTGTVQIVISRRGGGTQQATRLKWFANGNVTGPTLNANQPVTFGHSAAQNAASVAAYAYTYLPKVPPGNFKPLLEAFSSAGPVTILIDKDGNRMSFPETRKKPDIAAIDGVNTTFFPPGAGQDFEASYPGAADGFPNFFGTSAAAPHAAGVAALMIQKAGGPGSMTGPQVYTIMQNTAPVRDADKFVATASGTNGGATVKITASNLASFANANTDPNFFTVNFTSNVPGQTLTSLTINVSTTDILFETSAAQGGNPFVVGTVSAGVTETGGTTGDNLPAFTVNYTGFSTGKSAGFGVGRRFLVFAGASRSRFGDQLGGATFTATLSGGGTVTGTFVNKIQKGWTLLDGYGLIDAQAAVNAIP